MCFDGPIFVFPLLKPHVFWWTPKPHVFWWTLPLLKPHVFWWTQKPHVFWWTHLCSPPPKTSCVLMDPKTSCVLMDPLPHVIWWTWRVHQNTWVPKSDKIIGILKLEKKLLQTDSAFFPCLFWKTFNTKCEMPIEPHLVLKHILYISTPKNPIF